MQSSSDRTGKCFVEPCTGTLELVVKGPKTRTPYKGTATCAQVVGALAQGQDSAACAHRRQMREYVRTQGFGILGFGGSFRAT